MGTANLFDWSGRVSRSCYVFWGLALLAVRWNLDRALSQGFAGRPFQPLVYLNPMDGVLLDQTFGGQSSWFGFWFLATSIPFAAVGAGLTLQRLRDAGLPLRLVAGFFFPYINLLLFSALSLLPSKPRDEAERAVPAFFRWLPRSAMGSALAGAFMPLPVALAASWVAISVFKEYALGIFIGLPFVQGLWAAVAYNAVERRTLRGTLGVACTSILLLGGVLLAAAVEGIICLLMALPLALPFALLGAWIGYRIMPARTEGAPYVTVGAFIALPLLVAAESAWLPATSTEREVLSTIEIEAPPEVVWRHVVSFSTLPPPDDWLFRTGVAYPLRAEISGCGPGAMRRCVFSTGPFLEPITVWDEPRELAFGVIAQPAAMDEMSPWPEVHARHLDGYLTVRRGQFLLHRTPSGGTLLEGRTCYAQDLWPTSYWFPWSDWIIHRIHLRVLNHIRREAETDR